MSRYFKPVVTTLMLLITACGSAPTQASQPEPPAATEAPAATAAPLVTEAPTATEVRTLYGQYGGDWQDARNSLGVNSMEIEDWNTYGIRASTMPVKYWSHEKYLTVVSKTDRYRVETTGPGMFIMLPTTGTYRIFVSGTAGLKSSEDILTGVSALGHLLETGDENIVVAAMTNEGPLVFGETPSWIGWDLHTVTSLDPRVARLKLNMDTVLPASYAVAAEFVVCKSGVSAGWIHTDEEKNLCPDGMKSRNGIYFPDEAVLDVDAFINSNSFFFMKTAQGFSIEPTMLIWPYDVTIAEWGTFDAGLFVVPTPTATPKK